MDPKIIPIAECRSRWLYSMDSRNLSMGVYNDSNKGFIGVRTKFRDSYLFAEYHWDVGEPFGTAIPHSALEQIPDDIELSDSSFNQQLFEWMIQAEERYGRKP